ncbi:hypothetical protein J1N35_003422 [Gossypium stocksii]|uniref:tRNA (adenine(58)-N(1))-methyltransferase n=1 Tax=Gossypium stocksii TaxID=47602 RepID=A0A9D3WAT8_9ROSI|nr:hypothetical protein J1N35_003422 [Gossypium stocksii]
MAIGFKMVARSGSMDQTAYLPKCKLAPEKLEKVKKGKSNKSKALGLSTAKPYWIGKPFGSIIFSNRGGLVELWTLILSHRTQILYIADISFVIMYLEVVPGCLVLETGTGSGSLTTLFARAVAPTGRVYL